MRENSIPSSRRASAWSGVFPLIPANQGAPTVMSAFEVLLEPTR